MQAEVRHHLFPVILPLFGGVIAAESRVIIVMIPFGNEDGHRQPSEVLNTAQALGPFL